jgi:hypothetical protein
LIILREEPESPLLARPLELLARCAPNSAYAEGLAEAATTIKDPETRRLALAALAHHGPTLENRLLALEAML